MAVLTYNGNIIGKSSANDGVLTIKRNGTTIQEFSANQSSNAIADISVPTKTSDLNNDSGFIQSYNVGSAVNPVTNRPQDYRAVYFNTVLSTWSGLFPANNNANGIFAFNLHPGDYNAQIGFSGGRGKIYYRNFNGSPLDTTTPWKQIITSGDTDIVSDTITKNITPTRADLLDIKKSSHVVQLAFNNVVYSQSFNTDTLILTLPYKPKMLTRFMLTYTVTSGIAQALCYIDTNGQVLINFYSANQYLYGSVTYLTDD